MKTDNSQELHPSAPRPRISFDRSIKLYEKLMLAICFGFERIDICQITMELEGVGVNDSSQNYKILSL